MILAIITAIVIVGLTYRRKSQSELAKGKSFWDNYKSILVLLGIVLIPMIVLNIFLPTVKLSPDTVVEEAVERGKQYEVLAAKKYNAMSFPDSIPLHFDYIEEFTDYYQAFKNATYDPKEFTSDTSKWGLLERYAHALKSVGSPFDSFDSRDSVTTILEDQPYENFVNGVEAYRKGNMYAAEKSFIAETKLTPYFDDSYLCLYKIYASDDERLRPFLESSDNAKHLPLSLLKREYYRLGDVGRYLLTINKRSFYQPNPFALLAGLLISIVWMIFLRSMDLFDKERWWDIIVVFVGGALFTNFCLPLYDLADYNFGFYLNGEAWNDFLYCTLVIGGSEELVKFIPWILFVSTSKRVNEPYDYLLYASTAALGFAFTENLSYLQDSENIVGRSILSTVAHMFDASIVAYGFILAKYRYKKRWMKIVAPIAGFALAMLAHGFYDFWLISASTSGLGFITIVFFVLTLHVWMFMINNATNHSTFYNFKAVNLKYPQDLLVFSILGMVTLQFIFLSIQYGASYANWRLQATAWIAAAFLIYMTFLLSNFTPVRGLWNSYNIPIPTFLTSWMSLPKRSVKSDDDCTGLELRLFVPKTNPHIGSLLPVSGKCYQRIVVNNDYTWYLFELNAPLGYAGYNEHFVIVRPKLDNRSLREDKIEIFLMLIPTALDPIPAELTTGELRYTGRAYSRPI